MASSYSALAVVEREVEDAVGDESVQAERGGTETLAADAGARGFRGCLQGGVVVDALVELAEVVEDQLWRMRLRGHELRVPADPAQNTVADAVVRECAVLLLHGLDDIGDVVAGAVESEREDGREPAHGLGGVELLEERFAAVSFEGDPQAG